MKGNEEADHPASTTLKPYEVGRQAPGPLASARPGAVFNDMELT